MAASKLPNLLNAIAVGRSAAGHLQRRADQTRLRASAILEDTDNALTEAEAKTAGDHPLWVRAWAVTTARAAVNISGDQASALVTRAEALLDRLDALDQKEFGPLQDDLKSGRYSPEAFLREIETMNPGARDAFAQRLFAVHNVPARTTARLPGMVHYLPSPIGAIIAIAKHCEPDDVFCDVGSGLGLVVLLIVWLSRARGIGVEIEPAYVDTARDITAALEFDGVSFTTADARSFDLSDVTVLYFYDTFRGELLDGFMERLRDRAAHGSLKIASRGKCNPLFESQDWLTVIDRVPSENLLVLASTDTAK